MTRPVPYPADTKAKGWRFEIDYEQVEQSDTWDVASEVPMAQHALLFMWMAAWTQVPCGSFPADENIIRAKCRIPAKLWPALQPILMRGWWLAEDGRLYHDTIVKRVGEMLEYRRKESERRTRNRGKQPGLPSVSRGTTDGHTQDTTGVPDTGTGTGTGTIKNTSPDGDVVEKVFSTSTEAGANGVQTSPPAVEAQPGADPPADNCPHQQLIDAYHAALPMCPRIRDWTPARATALRSRWREDPQRQSVDWWRRLFAYCAKSDFLTGKAHASPGRRAFVLSLDWLVKAENFAKVIEGRYENDDERIAA